MTERTVCFRVFICDDLICVLVVFFVIKLLSYENSELIWFFFVFVFFKMFLRIFSNNFAISSKWGRR